MAEFAIRLDPGNLSNPDLDIRYRLPDLIIERSGGVIVDNGYDYGTDNDTLFLFLKSDDVQAAQKAILDVVENVRVLDNDLRGAVAVALLGSTDDTVFYPADFVGEFGRPKD